MGFCYQGRKLCCDMCGTAGARKVKCAFNYCPPVAVCVACRKTQKTRLSKAAHEAMGCDKRAEAMKAYLAQRAALIEAGRPVRAAAANKDGRVQVLFDSKDGTVGYFMSKETYSAIPLGNNATIEDYAAIGPVEPAPSTFW